MHPILARRGRFALYQLIWLLLSAILAAALAQRGVQWSPALVVALPLGLAWGFVCLTSYYLCHYAPLRLGNWARIIGTHAGAASISASVWLTAGWGWIQLLGPGRLSPAIEDAYLGATPVLWAVGLLTFLLSSAVHYGLGAHEATREAEKLALEFQVLSRDAQLTTLRAQIHPHFLFNALNSINALIVHDPEGARRLCVLLADFLRASLTLGGRKRIALHEELEMAERLLSIEKVRFGSRLAFEIRIEEGVRECPIPPLVLQPLVENAVTHGIAHLLEGGTVAVEARRRGQRLELSVQNPRDSAAPRGKGAGVGLTNVRGRLAALYGRDGALQVVESEGSFRVVVGLPCEGGERGSGGAQRE
jgi:two-component system sensor histidine kinase AlgZ